VNHVFSIRGGITVPDGTTVFPFLSPHDDTSGLGSALFEGFSMAAGEIAPGTASAIHVLPRSTQVTFVLAGSLTARMQGEAAGPYTLRLSPHQACLTAPGERLQLANETDAPVRVLYIVSPAYHFETDAQGAVTHEDAVLLDDWDAGWDADRDDPHPEG
jgi:mannose-6-phosphate isomerase-like protein (cupin superfamily)